MHKATPYGHLLIDGQTPDEKTLAREFATTAGEVRRCLSELGKHGVYSTTPEGVIFSRRMVRDERRRQTNYQNAIEGGNPALSDNRKSHKSDIRPPPKSVIPDTRAPVSEAQKPDARSQKPVRLSFAGDRLEVPRFLDDEFSKRCPQGFDLTGWYLALDQELTKSGDPYTLQWIRARFDAVIAVQLPAVRAPNRQAVQLEDALDRLVTPARSVKGLLG